ncbi:MAG: acyltransferase [Nitrospira sp.]|nr:acyltransferase [Nitrospira sp.]
MLDPSPSRLVYLDSFRGLAIAMVVATHALGYAHLDQESEQLLGFLSRTIAVPVFFLVDGILFALGHQKLAAFDYAVYIRKSARRLLLPWVVFTVFYCALRIAFEYFDNSSVHVVYGQTWQEIAVAAYLSSFSSQMYFLLSLFLIRAFSKITYHVMHTRPMHRIVATIVYVAIFQSAPIQSYFLPGLDPIYHALWGMQFYLVGLSLQPFAPLWRTQGRWLSGTAIALGFVIAFFFQGMALYSQFLLLLGCYLLFFSNPTRFLFLSSLGRRSMGIYLVHIPLIMKVFSLLLARLLSPTSPMFFVVLSTATLYTSAFLTSVLLQHSYGRIILGEPLQSSSSVDLKQ